MALPPGDHVLGVVTAMRGAMTLGTVQEETQEWQFRLERGARALIEIELETGDAEFKEGITLSKKIR
jgi:hypothetical protein